MADEKAVKKPESIKPEEAKAEAVKQPAKPEVKAEAAKQPAKPEVKAEAVKQPAKPEVKAEAVKPSPEAKPEAPKAEAKKEADPSKEFVDGIMAEMSLKGASKKRLIKMLAEQFNFDKQKVMFRLKRALISERYAAAHAAEAGH
jgi:hypothetical protein